MTELTPPQPQTPTTRWMAAAADQFQPFEGPAGVAERLLLLVHYGVDWSDGWLSNKKHRDRYWEHSMPDRVIIGTYRANSSLRRWWRFVADDLGSSPRNPSERKELERLLRSEPLPVLAVLRWETEALLLRTRIVADAVKDARVQAAAVAR